MKICSVFSSANSPSPEASCQSYHHTAPLWECREVSSQGSDRSRLSQFYAPASDILHIFRWQHILPVGVGCPTISQMWDIRNYFYSWSFGGISDEIFIKTKEKYWKSTVRLTLQLYKGDSEKIQRKNLKSGYWHS